MHKNKRKDCFKQTVLIFLSLSGDRVKRKSYVSNACLLVVSTVLVKVISVLYKIPLTSLIGATGRGYFGIAYNLFIPFHAVCMGALPVVVSKLVSEASATNNLAKIGALRKASFRLMLLLGCGAMALLLLLAWPYCIYVGGGSGAFYCILALAPSIVFSCLSGARRGVFEGRMNMTPTAVSQLIDSLFKAVFGVLLARLAMGALYEEFLTSGTVLGQTAQSEMDALSLIYPLTSAASLGGVLIGDAISYFYLEAVNQKEKLLKKAAAPVKKATYRELVRLSLPIAAATAVSGIANILEQSSINYCLENMDTAFLKTVYAAPIELSGTADGDIPTYLFGVYNTVLDFKNLVPMLAGALGVAVVPAISSTLALRQKENCAYYMETVLKFSVILGGGAGFCFAAMPGQLIDVIYGQSNPDIAGAGADVLALFGFTMVAYAMLSPYVCALQSAGLGKDTILPFALGAAVKVAGNFLLCKTQLAMCGFALSSFLGTLFTLVWCAAAFHKKTGVKIRFAGCILRPFLASLLVYFGANVLQNLTVFGAEWLNTLFAAGASLSIYVVFLFLFGILDLKSFNLIRKC